MVKEGYKQTEVGVIPEDWDVVLLDSVAKRGSGHTPDKKYPEYWNGSIKWISLKDSDRLDALYIYDTADKTTPLGIANSSAVIHPAGTVVLSRDAGVGKSAIMGNEMAVSQHFMAWQCSPKLNNCLLYYWLQVKKPEFERIAIGNTIKTIGLPYFKQLKIPLPPSPEQRSIAQALSDVDALIAALDKAIAKKRSIKTATMQQLLTGKKRLPGFGEGKGYQQTEVGVIPEDWQVYSLRELCSAIVDGTHYTPSYVSDGVPFYSVENVTADDFENTKFISNEEHSRLIRRCKPEKGDLLLTRIGSLGATKLLDWDVDASIYVSLALLKLNERAYPTYVYAYSKSKQFFKDVEKRSLTNATPQKINMGDVGNVPIPTPLDQGEQRAIATVLSDMDAEIAALEARLAKTQALKQGMMQALLTGRVRLV
jgi:type I restriction enzyme S subunit